MEGKPPDKRLRANGYLGALRSYLNSIQKFKLLTRSGEHRLGVASQAGGEQARRKLVEANLRLVVKIAVDYRHTGLTLDELIAEGNLGLMEAARRFDPNRGVRFASYATWWIHKFMLAAVHRQKVQTSVPAPKDGKPPQKTGAEVRPPRVRIRSFEEFLQVSGDRHLLESVVAEDGGGASPETLAVEKDLEETLRSVLHRMPALEREILEARFGLGGEPPKTLQQIADGRGQTRERVRQLELRALERAKRLLER